MEYNALLFVILWLWRYVRLIVHIVSGWTLKPILPARYPWYTAKDVTVVVPTLGEDSRYLRSCLLSINSCRPKAIIIVTPNARVVRSICQTLGLFDVQVIAAPKANKRLQMIQGTEHVKSPVTVFSDDDVFWPSTFLPWILAPFEDATVGAVGPTISLERPDNYNLWDFLSTAYLVRWHFFIKATSNIDGGLACLSGRTFAMRSKIIQSDEWTTEFANEKWFFGIPLTSADDDCFVTRYLLNHGWAIKIQVATQAHCTTVLEHTSAFLGQCVRWHRTTWRSNITSMFVDRTIWTAQPWSAYAIHLSTFNPPAMVFDILLAYLLYHAYDNGPPTMPGFPETRSSAFILFILWIIFARTIKLWPHFLNHPEDLKYLPVNFAFCYFHGLIKMYTLFTIDRTTWDGGRSFLAKSVADVGSSIVSGVQGKGIKLPDAGTQDTLADKARLRCLPVKPNGSS
ncbi:MAG: hypothetical protein Q9174_005610 [Haloplaca sp. 1 TL-2023]